MKIKNRIRMAIVGSALVALTLTPAQAQYGLFTAQETTLDLGGYYGSRDRKGRDDSAWGPAVGINYFITRNIGVGADTYVEGLRLPYLINASAIYRYPIGDSGLAPYAFGGFGRQWNYGAQWTGHLGGGAEFRFGENTGIFGDIRYVIAERRDHTIARLGVRVRFP